VIGADARVMDLMAATRAPGSIRVWVRCGEYKAYLAGGLHNAGPRLPTGLFSGPILNLRVGYFDGRPEKFYHHGRGYGLTSHGHNRALSRR
jgi:hypothetical protein